MCNAKSHTLVRDCAVGQRQMTLMIAAKGYEDLRGAATFHREIFIDRMFLSSWRGDWSPDWIANAISLNFSGTMICHCMGSSNLIAPSTTAKLFNSQKIYKFQNHSAFTRRGEDRQRRTNCNRSNAIGISFSSSVQFYSRHLNDNVTNGLKVVLVIGGTEAATVQKRKLLFAMLGNFKLKCKFVVF